MKTKIIDHHVSRKDTNSIKWDSVEKLGYPKDVIPMWVADMDFLSEPHAVAVLQEKSNHGILGYSFADDDYEKAVKKWCWDNHQTDLSKATLISTPGVVSAVGACIQALTNQEDTVLIMEPVYHPFRKMIEINQRKVVVSELVIDSMSYKMDFADIESKIVLNNVKMVVFCSPHNPVGRVWTKEELLQLAQLCNTHQVVLISDEIHMDFVYPNHTHAMLVGLDTSYQEFVITLISASKTFNLADTHTSQLFVFNQLYADKIQQVYNKLGLNRLSSIGIEAQKQAYTHGQVYVKQVNETIQENRKIVNKVFADTKIKVMNSEGLYLLWLDFRAYEKEPSQLMELLIQQAKVWLINGEVFGKSGQGFFRMNIATSPQLVLKACNQIKEVFIHLI